MRGTPISATVEYVNEAIDARAAYRRKMQQRQTVLFSSIAAVLAALMILAMLFWTGIIPFPFNREFTKPADENAVVVPCLAASDDPLEPGSINVTVYNSTSTTGLAASVGTSLSDLGVVVAGTDNWKSSDDVDESARILTGTKGVAAAYSLQRYIEGSTVVYDEKNTSDTLAVVIGDDFTKRTESGEPVIKAVSEADAQKNLTSPEQCTEVD